MSNYPKTKKAIIFTIAAMFVSCLEALQVVNIMEERSSDPYWMVEDLLVVILVIIIGNLIASIVRIGALLKVSRGDSIGKISYIASWILRSLHIDLQILFFIMYVNIESVIYHDAVLEMLVGGVILLDFIAMCMDFGSRKENY